VESHHHSKNNSDSTAARLEEEPNLKMAKPVVFVIGASGNIGTATVAALSAKYADKVEIRAGVRNPDKADKLKAIAGVSVVQATMGDKDNLKGALKGVDSLYIVTPGAKDRMQLTIATAEAAKEAGVKFLLVVSVLTADLTDTVFGAQLSEVEDKVGKLGVPYAFLRLPFFVENLWGFKDSIVGQGAIYCPVDPEKPYTPIVVEDAGKAAAAILADPSKHAGKTYNIVSDRITYNDVAQGFSKALGKEIKYNRVPYEAAKQAFLGMGLPEWQVDGILELFKLFDSGAPETNVADLSDYEKITGEKPTSLKAWIAKYAPGFQ
jgi:uncharacterized protein YbjT (DUF2867 family)